MLDNFSTNSTTSRLFSTVGSLLLLSGFLVAGAACGNDEPEPRENQPEYRGEKGESCQTANDCKEELSCVSETCIKNEYDIESTANSCKVIECENKQDCCELSPTCESLKEDCEDEGDMFACNNYEAADCGECMEQNGDQVCSEACEMKCEDQKCVRDFSCEDDTDCPGTQTCDGDRCIECQNDDECDDGEKCDNGQCVEICEIDENCPLFHECQEGDCVETGCSSDRECVLFTENGESQCKDGTCVQPCTNDAECNRTRRGFFQICEDGTCKFVGCESDKGCRLALDLENTDKRAVCEGSGDGDGN